MRIADFLNPKCESWSLELPLLFELEQTLGVTLLRQPPWPRLRRSRGYGGQARSTVRQAHGSGQIPGEAQYQLRNADCGMENLETEIYKPTLQGHQSLLDSLGQAIKISGWRKGRIVPDGLV